MKRVTGALAAVVVSATEAKGPLATPGLQAFDPEKARDERPEYVLFNGRLGALLEQGALTAKAGETVRLFVGNGGPNLTSSFHISRAMDKGALGAVVVSGEERPDLFRSLTPGIADRPSGH